MISPKTNNKTKASITLFIIGLLPILVQFIDVLDFEIPLLLKGTKYAVGGFAGYFSIGIVWGVACRFIVKYISKNYILLTIIIDVVLITTLAKTNLILGVVYFLFLLPFFFIGFLLSIIVERVKSRQKKVLNIFLLIAIVLSIIITSLILNFIFTLTEFNTGNINKATSEIPFRRFSTVNSAISYCSGVH